MDKGRVSDLVCWFFATGVSANAEIPRGVSFMWRLMLQRKIVNLGGRGFSA
jgi:hypothetical protein